jgi:hypothetical protein
MHPRTNLYSYIARGLSIYDYYPVSVIWKSGRGILDIDFVRPWVWHL